VEETRPANPFFGSLHDGYSDAIKQHSARPGLRKAPIARASHRCVETYILEHQFCSQWSIFTSCAPTCRPTAIFAQNDLMAMGALLAIRELNLRCPQDISVIGFDDLEESKPQPLIKVRRRQRQNTLKKAIYVGWLPTLPSGPEI
jgi:DNA-binding LacI/PurR family transcriptional regulator